MSKVSDYSSGSERNSCLDLRQLVWSSYAVITTDHRQAFTYFTLSTRMIYRIIYSIFSTEHLQYEYIPVHICSFYPLVQNVHSKKYVPLCHFNYRGIILLSTQCRCSLETAMGQLLNGTASMRCSRKRRSFY